MPSDRPTPSSPPADSAGDRTLPSLLRILAIAPAMALVMLVVAALGEWVILPSSWVRAVDEGGVARGTAIAAAHPVVADAAHLWAVLSGPWCVIPCVALTAGALTWRRRTRARALLVVVIALLGSALGVACKELVERPRPAQALADLSSWSYPSGHATNVALGAVLLIALLRSVRTVWIRWGAMLLVALGTALTALDRLLLAVHYVSDVVAGLALGCGMGFVAIALLGPLTPLQSSRSESPDRSARHG